MSNASARWTLIAALALLTILTITLTTRLDAALTPAPAPAANR
ncbi:hypothetical protein [Kribbella sandramycini]|uniref:Uncharacterized protein n=1 Tax=Kribbella sandramycini TaxID=60450 RepID=A0A841S8C3_9ACTN|nr:hypothetical protein [Kribbella sandramycini]MBB6567509.1 hypothetical protein [Kribbella sandramycini]